MLRFYYYKMSDAVISRHFTFPAKMHIKKQVVRPAFLKIFLCISVFVAKHQDSRNGVYKKQTANLKSC